jgi:ribulose-phosphate 3-epimerase
MTLLVPSILETTKQGFLHTYQKEIQLPGVLRIQVDFGDGIFVPNNILPVTDIDLLTENIHWEAHLMVKEPMDFLDYKISGFKTIIVHYEAYENEEKLKNAIHSIKDLGLTPALCLKNETSISVAVNFLDSVKHFQLMSVYPGFQGTAFLENTYERVKELRKLAKDAIIEVDGGVNFENVKKISEAGADLIILGSVITKASSMGEAWEKINGRL